MKVGEPLEWIDRPFSISDLNKRWWHIRVNVDFHVLTPVLRIMSPIRAIVQDDLFAVETASEEDR